MHISLGHGTSQDTEELGSLRKESIRQRMVAFQKGASAGEAALARRRYLKRATVHEARVMPHKAIR